MDEILLFEKNNIHGESEVFSTLNNSAALIHFTTWTQARRIGSYARKVAARMAAAQMAAAQMVAAQTIRSGFWRSQQPH